MSTKDMMMVQALENLASAVEKLNHQSMKMEHFIIENFKGYHGSYIGDIHREILVAKQYINSLRLAAATNADNKHLLDKEEEVKKPEQPRERYRVSPYATSYMMPDVETPDIIGPPARPYTVSTYDKLYDPDLDF